MLLACLPFGPWVTSKLTFWPSFSVLKPCMLIAEKCANRSSPPPSGVMKPNPFASLNHFTVPVAIAFVSSKNKQNHRGAKPRPMFRFQGNCRRDNEGDRERPANVLSLETKTLSGGYTGTAAHARAVC